MALVRFHSKAGGDFFFMPDTQKQVFKVLGRPCTASGAISPEEAKEWIAILESAISREKADDKKREEDRKARAKRVAESFRTQAVHPASLLMKRRNSRRRTVCSAPISRLGRVPILCFSF